MAFPTIAATNTSNQPTNSLNHTVNLPASIAAGDELIVFFATNETPVVTTPAGWSLLATYTDVGGATCQVKVFYKVASGSEGSTLAVTIGTARMGAHASYRISSGTYSSIPEASAGATAGSGVPDSDSLTPAGGAKDYLWFSVGVNQNSSTITTAPSGYTTNSLFASSTSVSLGVGTRQLNATSEDPPGFNDGNGRWGAGTVAISPAAGGGAVVVQPTLLFMGVG